MQSPPCFNTMSVYQQLVAPSISLPFPKFKCGLLRPRAGTGETGAPVIRTKSADTDELESHARLPFFFSRTYGFRANTDASAKHSRTQTPPPPSLRNSDDDDDDDDTKCFRSRSHTEFRRRQSRERERGKRSAGRSNVFVDVRSAYTVKLKSQTPPVRANARFWNDM